MVAMLERSVGLDLDRSPELRLLRHRDATRLCVTPATESVPGFTWRYLARES